MVDCCVFVTILNSFTLLPVEIHVMGKQNQPNLNEIFQNALLALKQNYNVRQTAAKAHKIRNQK